MWSNYNKFFIRENLSSQRDVIKWWNKGRGLLNLFSFSYVIIHLAIIVFIFKNGWVFFLIPFIGLAFIVINIIFSLGLIFELVFSYSFKSRIYFNIMGPKIKVLQFVLCVLFILIISALDILRQ